MKRHLFILFIFFVLIFKQTIDAQTYGLEFASLNVEQDYRTGLNLFPKGIILINNNYELAFKIKLYRKDQIFGNILHAEINDTTNIDIQINYNNSFREYESFFSVIIGKKIYTFPNWKIDTSIFDKWIDIKIEFDVSGNQIYLYKNYLKTKVPFKFPRKIKCSIYFGTYKSKKYVSTDVPPMQLKDLRWYNDNRQIYFFPLDESNGNRAYDKEQKKVAEVYYPIWIKPRYMKWQLIKKISFPGRVVSTFDQNKGYIYFLKSDSLIVYSINSNITKRIPFTNGKQIIYVDSRIVIDYNSNVLYHYYLDTREFIKFDSVHNHWANILAKNSNIKRNFTQHNFYFSSNDSSFYFFGGYGYYHFKNSLFRYHIPNQTMSEIHLNGDLIHPRYLSALGGARNNDTIYILGGYGSESGDQRIEPHSYKDMYLVNLKNGRIKKINSLPSLNYDCCFGRSLIYSSDNHSFYGLIFDKHKFHNYLNLIMGNVGSSNFYFTGDSIPFLFNDVTSDIDLFLYNNKKQLICYTSIFDNDTTYFNYYAIQNPPNILSLKGSINFENKSYRMLLLIFIILALISLIFIVFMVLNKKSIVKNHLHQTIQLNNPKTIQFNEPADIKDKEIKNSMFLLGGFRIHDKDGIDISMSFTPLLKEFFLLIFFNSLNELKGISIELISQILWFDKDSNQARNNRSVNFSKLRHIIDKIEGLSFLKENGLWKMLVNQDKFWVDYLVIQQYLKKGVILPKNINSFINLIKNGGILTELSYDWLDPIKENFTNQILDILIVYIKNNTLDYNLKLSIADAILMHDLVNEQAIKLKYQTLISIGRHNMAKTVLEQFKAQYFKLYGEPFNFSNLED